MRFTGERFIPGAWDVESTFQRKMWQEHLARYLFGQAFVQGKAVLDVGCGVGYGTDLLMTSGARIVTGVDIAEEAIRHARAQYARRGVGFATADAARLPFQDKTFDVVLAFEMIEHLGDTSAFVREAKRVLKDHGVFVVSTPRRRGQLRSQFHTHEFALEEFEALLKSAFDSIVLFGENNCLITVIGKEPRIAGFSHVNFLKDLYVRESDYFIAVCGDPDTIPQTVAVVNSDEYVLGLERQVARLRGEEQQLRQQLGDSSPYVLRVWRMYRQIGVRGLLKRTLLYGLVRLGLTEYSSPDVPSVIDKALAVMREHGSVELWRSARRHYRRTRLARHLLRSSADRSPSQGRGTPSLRRQSPPRVSHDSIGGASPQSFKQGPEKPQVPERSITHLRIGWIIPPPSAGSGGHKNIFRAVRHLASVGHEVTVYLYDSERHDAGEIEAVIESEIGNTDAQVVTGTQGVKPGDVLFATHWSTVQAVLQNRDKAKCLLYFVQDFEPYFYPMSYEYISAESTYRAGLEIITSGPWCARLLRERYGVDAEWFAFPVDRQIYYPRRDVKRERNLIVYLARPEPRRLFPLGIEAIRIVKERRKDVDVILFGSDALPKDLPFECVNLGVVRDLETLARLYSTATLGLAFSVTNPSLVPYELMACGCPVIDVDHGDNDVNYGSRENIALVPPMPDKVAAVIEQLLGDDVLREKLARNGYNFVQSFPGEEEIGRIIEKFVLKRWAAASGGLGRTGGEETYTRQRENG